MVLMVTAVALRPWSVAEHLLCAGCSCESRAHSGGTAGFGSRFFFGGGVLCSAGCLGAALASPSGETPLLLCDTQTCPPRGRPEVPEVPWRPALPTADPTGPWL